MLFSSVEFICLFLPLTLVGAAVIAHFGRARWTLSYLIIISAVFYGRHIPIYLLLLAGSIGVNFLLGEALARNPARRLLAAGVAFNLGLLGYFKYANFFVGSFAFLTGGDGFAQNIALPLAISFFTFQQIAYLVDIWRGEAKPAGFLKFSLFVMFFPQLIAGPIVHHKEMTPQFGGRGFGRITRSNLYIGAAIFVIGLTKKTLMADPLGRVADTVFNAAAVGVEPSMSEAWVGAFAYSFQIYFDFSGYSDMAIGLARLFGIRLPANFLAPYKARSIIDFWRRWHITLSRFLRDYLYIPLGGNRQGPMRRHVNLLIVMLLGGLWHGAAWTFVVWGGLHGFYLIINHGLRHWAKAPVARIMATRQGQIGGVALTFFAVTVAWIFFRASSFDSAFIMLSSMAGMGAEGGLSIIRHSEEVLLRLAVAGGIVWLAPASMEILEKLEAAPQLALARPTVSWRPLAYGALGAVCLFTIYVSGSDEFLYFQF